MNYLTEQELNDVLTIAERNSTRDWLMILFAYTHGLRAGEVVNIRIGDIKGGILTVQRLKNSNKTQQELRVHGGNPLMNEVTGLKRYMSERPSHCGDALFLTKYGTAMSTRNFHQIFRQYAFQAGLPSDKWNCHILKHTCGTNMQKAPGVTAFDIAHRLGHKDIKSTQQYVHPNDQDVDRKFNQMMMEMF